MRYACASVAVHTPPPPLVLHHCHDAALSGGYGVVKKNNEIFLAVGSLPTAVKTLKVTVVYSTLVYFSLVFFYLTNMKWILRCCRASTVCTMKPLGWCCWSRLRCAGLYYMAGQRLPRSLHRTPPEKFGAVRLFL